MDRSSAETRGSPPRCPGRHRGPARRGRPPGIRRSRRLGLQSPATTPGPLHEQYVRRWGASPPPRAADGHEPRSLGHGPDRRAVRRGRRGARLPGPGRPGGPAGSGAPQAAGPGPGLPALRGQRPPPVGLLRASGSARRRRSSPSTSSSTTARWSSWRRAARNRTPDKLPAAEAAPLFAACDRRPAPAGRAVSAGVGGRRGRLRPARSWRRCSARRPPGGPRRTGPAHRHRAAPEPGQPGGQPGLGRGGGKAAQDTGNLDRTLPEPAMHDVPGTQWAVPIRILIS